MNFHTNLLENQKLNLYASLEKRVTYLYIIHGFRKDATIIFT